MILATTAGDHIAGDHSDATQMEGRNGTLLLVTAVRLRKGPRGLQLDDQTCAGVCRWAESFEKVVYAGILLEAEQEESTSINWVDVRDLPCADRLRFLALPMAYRIGAFARSYRSTCRLLAEEIRQADHLCFTLGYFAGDWAAVAALEALAQRRRYAVWFDRVEHEVLRNALRAMPLKRRIKESLTLPVMQRYHRHLIRHSTLGLFQGMDTFNAYSAFCSNPACVYDVHTRPEDFPPPSAIDRKVAQIEDGAPLRIVYAGRAADMKGPFDWLQAIAQARHHGIGLQARWLGDGPLLDDMKRLAASLGIADSVAFSGFVSDRGLILSEMRDAHLFLFCHKTPESPRCLIEALVSACPIVGYATAYPQGLIAADGGGVLTGMNDIEALSASIAGLDADRSRLGRLVREAAASGRCFDEKKLYRERAALIATHA
jgi:glycosyltransferase involved in cell wall biosynthesis